MATDDTQVLVAGTADAPCQFTIPGNGQRRPKAIFASYDGTGAAVDFVPAIKIISDGGEVVAICPTDTTVVAGASADVSWFPRVGGGASSAAVSFQWCRVVCGPSTPSGSIALPQTGTLMPIADFSTSDPANYTQVDANTWSIPDRPQIICGYMLVDGGGLTTLNGDVYVIASKAGGTAIGAFGQNTHKLLVEYFSYTLTRNLETGGDWVCYAAGTDTHNFDIVVTFAAVY